ncbi:MAG: YfjI family protein [Actinomycetota bacterium]
MSAAIRQALGALSEPGQVIELRILRARHTRSGYFDELDRAAEAAAKLNGTASVYMTLNPCDPVLLARGVNRIVEYPEATTSDRDILRRVWFPIDLDPVRPAGVSSTEAEHEAAIARAREVFGHLRSEGWPKPLVADSGNGAHLLYRIALPNDAESTELLKRCLQALALRFGDDLVSVDEKVFNAARIWKVYGTIACKGDNTPERPHRQAKLLRVPDELGVVSLDKLIALAGTVPKPSQGDARYSGGERFDLDRWIPDHGLDVAGSIEWSGGRKWIFRVCPWNEEHRNRSAYIVQFSSGAIAAGCHHNGCNGKDWSALRSMYEPGYREHGTHGEAPAGSSVKSEWPEPQPLPDGLPPVAGFDFSLLPDTLRPWAEDICDRIQCAPAYVGTAIIASVGSVIGRKIGIRPQAHTDWTEYANQWALLIGRPGVLKSPAMEQALGPVRRLAALAIEAHKGEMMRYTTRLKAAEKNDEDPPEKPVLKRYVANDTTAAALGELHRQNPNGVLVHRDEAVSLLRSLDREENSEARGFYLTGWNGNSPYTFDRIIRGLNLHIPAVCLSVLGSTQPGRIGSYLQAACAGGAGDDGLIQRFGLLVWPDTPDDWEDVDRWPNAKAKRAAFELFDYLDKASGLDLGGQQGEYEETPFLRFDGGGLDLFQQWRRGLEARLRSEQLHPALESHLAKYRKLVPGLALILHLVGRGTGPVSEKATTHSDGV